MGRLLVFYKTEKGQCPVAEFLNSLPARVAQKVTWVLKLLQELDTVPSQYFKKLSATAEIWECRMVSSGDTYRILCFFRGGNTQEELDETAWCAIAIGGAPVRMFYQEQLQAHSKAG